MNLSNVVNLRRGRSASLDLSEAELQSQVLELAGRVGWRAFHAYDSRRSQPGFPDLMLVRGRRLIAAELKSRRGRLTDEQAAWLDALAHAGVETYVWRPSDWAELEEVLTRAA